MSQDGTPPDISVIMPTQANGRGLERAARSALTQAGVSVELVVIVDGTVAPSDEDGEFLASLGPGHQVVFLPKVGRPGALRNVALALVRANVVAFLDDDDWWEDGKLAQQLAIHQDRGDVLVATNARRIEDGEPAGVYHPDLPPEVGVQELLQTNWIVTSSVTVVADALRRVGGFPIASSFRACDDYAAWLKLSFVGSITVLPQALVNYTVQSVSVSSQDQLSGQATRALVVGDLLRSTSLWRTKLTLRERRLVSRYVDDLSPDKTSLANAQRTNSRS